MTDKRALQRLFLAMLAVVGLLATPRLGAAHPLGNFSISHYTAIHIEPDALVLRYVIDMAEIPTFQEIQDMNIVPQPGHSSLPAYLTQRVKAFREGLVLEINGQHMLLSSEASEVIFPPGAGGLPTLKLGMLWRVPLDRESAVTVHELRYRDTNFPGRAGWKEIIATSGQEIILLSSTVPADDRSHALTDYPNDLLNSPPQDVEARVVFARQARVPAAAAVGTLQPGTARPPQEQHVSSPPEGEEQAGGEQPRQSHVPTRTLLRRGREDMVLGGVQSRIAPARVEVNRPMTSRSSFTELITTPQLGFGIVLVAMVVAVGLGVASGLIIAGLGCSLFLRRYAGSVHADSPEHEHGHTHVHGHAHHHTHGPEEEHVHTQAHHAHPHPHHSHHHHVPSAVSLRELLALGVTGGIIPCPAALVVLLSALSLNRVGFGLLLIVAFSIGLAAVLIAIGILMVYAHRLMTRFQGDGMLITRWLPLTSAAVMTVFGMAIAVQALVAAGIVQIRL
jgi:nickel/cobalt exporter